MSYTQILQEAEFKEFSYFIDRYLQEPILTELFLNEGLFSTVVEKMRMIKELAKNLGLEIKNFIILFKEKYIFDFFKAIKWSVEKFIKIVKDGYNLYSETIHIIAKWAAENKIVKWTEDKIVLLDEFLRVHPKLKTVTGIAVAGFLIYQWTQLISFTGDVNFDFDQSALFQALSGNYNLVDIFAGAEGIKMLMFIVTNLTVALSFPWPGGTWVLFGFSLLFTVAKYKYPKVALAMHPLLKNISKLKKIKN
jgi:hypothetical protein